MKAKFLVVIAIGLLVASFVSSSRVVAAKSSGPVAGKSPVDPPRPEKLEQVIFVHPVAPDRPQDPGKGKKPPEEQQPKDNTYYELWGGYLDQPAAYYINPNIGLVTAGDPVAAVNNGTEAWDIVTADEVFSYVGTTEKSWYEQDGQNTISWVKFVPRDYIAIAVMWYDPNTMIIYEFDIVFNTFHRWGIEPAKGDRAFDIQNITTHELGHPAGLDDLYDDIYSELTMYGYSSKGEIEKCSLEEGDVAGAQSIYGAP